MRDQQDGSFCDGQHTDWKTAWKKPPKIPMEGSDTSRTCCAHLQLAKEARSPIHTNTRGPLYPIVSQSIPSITQSSKATVWFGFFFFLQCKLKILDFCS